MVKKDKGKARAVDVDTPSERSPLLGDNGSPSRSQSRPVHPHIAAIQSERARESRTRSILYIALIISLSLLAAFGLFLALLLNSFRPSTTELDSLQDTAFQYAGPDGISVVNVTEDGILVNVSLRAGIDWDRALGIQQWVNEEEKQQAVWKGDRGTGADWWENLRHWTAGKMMAQLSEPVVRVMIPDQVLILPDHFDTFPLLRVSLPSEFQVPLVGNVKPSNQDWLPPLSILALAKPIASTGDLLAFAQKAWEHGELNVVIGVPKAQATIPLQGFLSRWAKIEKLDVTKQITMPGKSLLFNTSTISMIVSFFSRIPILSSSKKETERLILPQSHIYLVYHYPVNRSISRRLSTSNHIHLVQGVMNSISTLVRLYPTSLQTSM